MTSDQRRDEILGLVIHNTVFGHVQGFKQGLVWKRYTLNPYFDADIGDGNELSLRYVHRYVLPDYLMLFRRPEEEKFMMDWANHRITTGGPAMKQLWKAIQRNIQRRKIDEAAALTNQQIAAEERLLQLLRGKG